MSLRYSIRILDHLTHRDYVPSTLQQLARQMHIAPDDLEEFRESLEHLAAEGRVELGSDQRWRLPDFGAEVTGIYKQHPRGFGFVDPDTPTRHGGLYIPVGAGGDAVSGDRVLARVGRRSRGDAPGRGPSGVVVKVLERGRSEFVGTLVQRGRQWLVEPDGRVLRSPVIIRDPFAKNAKAGDKVVFEITRYPDEHSLGEGAIVRRLGESGRPDVETQAVIAAHSLRQEFPEAALEEARRAAQSFERESAGPWPFREDLTDRFIFTIDPPDAKDFDDAISVEHDEATGSWRLGVHIADVSHFVRPGSVLDEEARERGNSVYLPRLVLPMLPEALSNGVCSLQEGVVRFTKSSFIEFDARGRVEGHRLAATVIRSAKRLTYLEAQALIDGDEALAATHSRSDPVYSKELIETLRLCDRLARLLEKRRQADGMISLDLPQVELVFDDEGRVIDARPEDDAYTHKIIEMFMVEANESLARTFADLGLPLIRRIHPEPTFGDIETLRKYARLARWRLPESPTRQDLQALLEATRGTPAARAIHLAVLRTFTKATYSPALIGHFALASDHYTHFTSPIRRYPDLAVHRAMQAYLDETENGARRPGGRQRRVIANRLLQDERVLSEQDLLALGRHCSETEVAAEEAEDELRTFLVLQLLKEKHLGDEFEGVVSGVSGNAAYVTLDRFLVDGTVRSAGLPGRSGRSDHWTMQEATGRLVALRSGMSIGLGDQVMVQVVAVDLPSRTLELAIRKVLASSATAARADRDDRAERSERSERRNGPKRRPGPQRKSRGRRR